MGTSQFYKLWADNSGVRATAAGPKSWGAEEYLYTQDVEDAFQDIETRIARLQGKLQSGGATVNGTADLVLTFWNHPTAGDEQANKL